MMETQSRSETTFWTVGRKLIAGFLLVASLVGLVGVIGSQRINVAAHDAQNISVLGKDGARLCAIETLVEKQLALEGNFLLSGDLKYVAQHKKVHQEAAS